MTHQQPQITNRKVLSAPSSLDGTLRASKESAIALRRFNLSEDLSRELKNLDVNNNQEINIPGDEDIKTACLEAISFKLDQENDTINKVDNNQQHNVQKNPRAVIFKFILGQDGRLIKYLARVYDWCHF